MTRRLLTQSSIRHFSQIFSLTILFAALTACGGGGGSDSISAASSSSSFTLQGSIAIAAGSLIDSDINNDSNTNFSNNSPLEAQPIPSFTVLGGYVNEAMTGAAGPLFNAGDPADYFSIFLYEGQSIVLDIYDADNADLDLYLLNSTGLNVLDFSISTTASESLVAPYEGEFQLMVEAFNGASNYTLRTDQTINVSSTSFRLSDSFVANEMIVYYRQAESFIQQQSDIQSSLNRWNLHKLAGQANRPMRMRIGGRKSGINPSLSNPFTATARITTQNLSFKSSEDEEKYATLLAIKAMKNDPEILYVEPNLIIQSSAIPNDPRYNEQWNFPLIELPEAWDVTTGTSEVIVAVIDSGILSEHPEIADNLVSGYDFIKDPDNALDGNGLDSDPEDLSTSYHGTHVAGIIAGIGNNAVGVTGIGWNTSIMPLRVLGSSGGNLYDVMQAVRYAAGLENDSGLVPVEPADIINLSIGGTGFCPDTYRDTLSEVRTQNIVVVAAAGNGNDGTNRFIPANCNDVFAVSALGQDKELAPYSNYGSIIDFSAPGGRDDADFDNNGVTDGILSLSGSQSGNTVSYNYSYRFGTSMAVPHVSGVIALMLTVNPALTVDDIEQLMISGSLTDDLGIVGKDNLFGHGMINARKAVAAALDSISNPPSLNSYLSSSVSTVEFRPALTETSFETRNIGENFVTINSVNFSADWLQVTQPQNIGEIDDWGLSVDRRDLAAGLYHDTLSIETSSNTLNIDIVLQVNSPSQVYEMGPLLISLVNASTEVTQAQSTIKALSGNYLFDFSNLDADSYRITVSSDLNGAEHGDGGEAYAETQAFLLNNNTALPALSLEWDRPLISTP